MKFLSAVVSFLFLACLLLSLTPMSGSAAAGDLDTLNLALTAGAQVNAVALQPDGKTIIGGSFTQVLGTARANIARLNADGTLDTTFDPKTNGAVNAVAVQADGKIVLGGAFTSLQPNGAASATTCYYAARVNADGTLDATITSPLIFNGPVYALALQADGRLLAGGAFQTVGYPGEGIEAIGYDAIVRLNTDGTRDSAFGPRPSAPVYCIAVRPDGKILIGGDFRLVAPPTGYSGSRRCMALINADGTVDPDFNPRPNNIVRTLAVQTDGKVLLGGDFTALQPGSSASPTTTRNYVARVNADGTLDTAFNPTASAAASSLALQADGKVLVGGEFTTLSPNGGSAVTRNRVARLNTDGTLDSGFNPNANGIVNAVALQADGKALLGGVFTTLTPNGGSAGTRNFFARLLNDAATQTLSATGSTTLSWTRGGTTPEVTDVTFEQSVNSGTSWTSLGAGTRVAGGWQRTGLSLPASAMLRARGRTAGGQYGGSAGIIEQVITIVPSTNARLSGLALTGATLTPVFAPGTLSYSATVPNGTSSLAFTATKEDATATVSGDASPKALVVGNNTLTVVVTAQDGVTTQTYTVTIQRQTVGETSVSTWAAGLGVPAASQGALDDPDRDGQFNLQEFAFGTGPLTASGGALEYSGSLAGGGTLVRTGQPIVMSETVGSVTQWHALFIRRTNHVAAGITYVASFSGDLVAWEASVVTPTVLADNGTHQVVWVAFPALVGGLEARFFRLSVSAAP